MLSVFYKVQAMKLFQVFSLIALLLVAFAGPALAGGCGFGGSSLTFGYSQPFASNSFVHGGVGSQQLFVNQLAAQQAYANALAFQNQRFFVANNFHRQPLVAVRGFGRNNVVVGRSVSVRAPFVAVNAGGRNRISVRRGAFGRTIIRRQ